MPADRLRSVSVDLPDTVVRRIARHVGRNGNGGFSAIVEQALADWADREEADGRALRDSGETGLDDDERRRQAV
jgi:Arc/MetJ-type ribon-helix-helix transcriptional regulator